GSGRCTPGATFTPAERLTGKRVQKAHPLQWVGLKEGWFVMLARVRTLLEMIRFSHTIFALPFALLSALLAWQKPGSFHVLDLVGLLPCMVFARSGAMAFNRLADRHLDALNPRTAQRHLPTGQLSPGAVWVFTLLCAVGFIASTGLFLLRDEPNP